MKNCPKCGSMFSDSATDCPACASPSPPAAGEQARAKPTPKAVGHAPAGVFTRPLGFLGCFVTFLVLIGLFLISGVFYGTRLQRGSGRGYMTGHLGQIRSALSIYYGDMNGQYPSDLRALTVGGKYLPTIPYAWGGGETQYVEGHARTDEAINYSATKSHDTGRWAYDNIPKDGNFGHVWIDCTHTDAKGSVWSSY